jgi:hypothetical protein
MEETLTPAAIYRQIMNHADETLPKPARDNLDVVIDANWIFLHSKRFKEHNRLNSYRYIGKWKYNPSDHAELLEQAKNLLLHVSENSLPVVKITNFGNMPNSELQLVVYCFPGIAEPSSVKEILLESRLNGFYWGSNRFAEPIESNLL